jgi:hypothetical protein
VVVDCARAYTARSVALYRFIMQTSTFRKLIPWTYTITFSHALNASECFSLERKRDVRYLFILFRVNFFVRKVRLPNVNGTRITIMEIRRTARRSGPLFGRTNGIIFFFSPYLLSIPQVANNIVAEMETSI